MVVSELIEAFDYAKEISIYHDGSTQTYLCGEDKFEDIITGWNKLLSESHIMPAYGVSLNYETLKAMQKGLWAEFVFSETMEHNGLPFEKLLINVEKEFYGFNIIRYNTGYGYDGRCFYIDLVNKNMEEFYDILVNL